MSKEITIICPSRGHGGVLPDVDLGIRAFPGVVVVLMDTLPERKGEIFLPDIAADDRPDSGVVIAAGSDTGFEVGEHVLVAPFSGVWFRSALFNGYRLWEVRFYGIADIDEYDSVRHKVGDMIPAAVSGGVLKPKQDWCLIRRDPVKETQSGIYLPDSSRYRTCKATVVSVGPQVVDVKPGMRIMYHGPSVFVQLKGLIELIPDLEGDPADYCLVKESGIYLELC